LEIFVLLIVLRSSLGVMSILNELLIDPAPALVTPPDFSEDKPARDRSPRNNYGP
jgi:hypothetical protein